MYPKTPQLNRARQSRPILSVKSLQSCCDFVTTNQIQLVRSSWARILPIKGAAAELFYARLFNRYPEVRPYFQGNMKDQGHKLMVMIDTAVRSIDRLENLSEPLRQMGRRHQDYGVRLEDYPKVAESLLWTLEKGLGEGFTEEVRAAWTQAYERIAAVMIEGTR